MPIKIRSEKVSRQEDMQDCMEYARELAQAERELKIENWVYVSIGYHTKDRKQVQLYRYDLPRDMEKRYRWVIRWRIAKLQCQYPREYMEACYNYYDKRSGLKTDFNSCLISLASAKAKITIAKRRAEEYVKRQKEACPLFYDPSEDPELEKHLEKIKTKEQNCEALRIKIRNAVEQYKKQIISL